jgi:hypothetical protein
VESALLTQLDAATLARLNNDQRELLRLEGPALRGN